MVNGGKGQCDSFRRRFRGVLYRGYPSIAFKKEGVIREEGGGVPIWTHAQEDEIEYWKASRVFHCEFANEGLFVCVRELFKVVEEGWIDGVDVVLRNSDFGEKRVHTSIVVRIGVIKGDSTFVNVVDLPINLAKKSELVGRHFG